MDIKGKLKFIGALPPLMAVIFGLSLFLGHEHLFQLHETTQLAEAIENEVDRLESTAFEYFDQRMGRPRQQTYEAFETTSEHLRQAETLFHRPEDQELIDEISARLKEARWSFEEFDRLTQQQLNPVQQAYLRDIALRLNIDTRSIKPLLERLHRGSHERSQAFSKRLQLINLGLITVTAILVAGLTLPVLYRINTGLKALTRATRELGSGGLSRELTLQGHDEFSRLAREFNNMAHRLAAAEAARIKRTDELETAIRDLEGFSYSVSHDLRAPLRAIDGFIAILQEDYEDKLDAEGKRIFGVVRENANRMSRLIDDILALSRAGRQELQHVEVDMNSLVDEIWAGMPRRGRDIRFLRGELPNVPCDRRSIRLIWRNLLENAVKFTRGRDPAVIEVSAETGQDMVHYRVRDNGVGFKPAYADKLFVLFQRLHGMDEYEGTGVGLALIKRLTQRHGGRVSATGQEDAGATFTFSLPLQPRSV